MTPPTRGRVIVVGLGPADTDLVTEGTRLAIEATQHRYLRTTRHPAARLLEGAPSFDELYETADHIDQVYAGIVERLVETAAAVAPEPVLYAVPGSPLVAEHAVQLLLADPRVEVEVEAALSFLDLLWVRLGVDPLAHTVTVVDGRRFAVDAASGLGPLVVCQCDSPLVLSDIKLAVEEWPEEPVTVVQRLGLPDERVMTVAWEDLDRTVAADHLTTLFIPRLGAPIAAELVAFDELVHALRVGCPWDRQQTHQSLRRYLLEECHELLEAIDVLGDEPDESAVEALGEELGDVLFQVFFHATIAAEAGWFTLADVARGVHDKLRDRHPHVFGTASFGSAEELARSWEAAKRDEKGRASVFDGVPATLPALALALQIQKKAATVDVAVAPDVASAARRFVEEPGERSLAALLWDVVALARTAGLDPESALRAATSRFRDATPA